ncbi:MAG: hypothetical protein AAFO94_21800, partial [Bacteroidota bacterium]
YIKDKNGCTVYKETTIGVDNSNFYFNAIPTAAHCETPGSIRFNTFYGKPPFLITVKGPVSGQAQTNLTSFRIKNLPGGKYTITIEDADWCSHTETVHVEDENMTIQTKGNNGICGKPGSIDVDIENGKANYVIQWEGPVSGEQTTSSESYTISNLPSGTYKITVMDGNWCADYSVVEIDNSQNNLDVDAVPINGVCELGAIWVDINNGEGPYHVRWEGPESGQGSTENNGFDIRDLQSGVYTIYVKDSNGCTDYEIVQLENHFGPSVSLSATKVVCDKKGSIKVQLSGGAPDFFIQWEGPVDGDVQTDESSYTITDLPAGNYKITVHDAYSCTSVKYIEVKEKADDLE